MDLKRVLNLAINIGASSMLGISFLFAQSPVRMDYLGSFIQDPKQIALQLIYDDQELPAYYSADIFTQVCETGECKPVRIILNWDLTGNYLNYEMPPGAILTKMDHIPFNAGDYQKFASILNDRYSILADFNLSELKGHKEGATIQEIDGITGATPKSIENAIVPGAVYTCYTIWHLAHGSIKDTIREKSQLLQTEEILSNFINHKNPDYQRWAIDQIFQSFSQHKQLVGQALQLIESSQIFIKKHVLQQIPQSLLTKADIQKYLWNQYPNLTYSLQLLMLRRYSGTKVIPEVSDLLERYRAGANEEQKSLFQTIRFFP